MTTKKNLLQITKKKWEQPNIAKLNVKKTASGTSTHGETHPNFASSL